jgi:hypothetical protein
MTPFPLMKNHCALANYDFAAVFAAPKLAGLWHLGQPLSGANHLATAIRQKWAMLLQN